jgi:hypothetical protein
MKSRPANPSPDDSPSRLAVLIDADNAQPSVIEGRWSMSCPSAPAR